jgi:hypothetical protein
VAVRGRLGRLIKRDRNCWWGKVHLLAILAWRHAELQEPEYPSSISSFKSSPSVPSSLPPPYPPFYNFYHNSPNMKLYIRSQSSSSNYASSIHSLPSNPESLIPPKPISTTPPLRIYTSLNTHVIAVANSSQKSIAPSGTQSANAKVRSVAIASLKPRTIPSTISIATIATNAIVSLLGGGPSSRGQVELCMAWDGAAPGLSVLSGMVMMWAG